MSNATITLGLGISYETSDARNCSGPISGPLRRCNETTGQSAALSFEHDGHIHVHEQEETLRAAGITHIICVRQEQEAKFIRENMPQSFSYHKLDIADSPCENIIRFFPSVSTHLFHNLSDLSNDG